MHYKYNLVNDNSIIHVIKIFTYFQNGNLETNYKS